MNQLELLTAPPPPKMPAEPIIRSAEIEGDCRWTLRRAWGPGPSILWCGLNPSTADGTRDDPTMLREIGFSFRWGFGSLIKVNMFPFRSSKPAELRKWLKTDASEDACDENIERVRAAIPNVDKVVAAWGAGAIKYASDFLTSVHWDDEIPWRWQCLGVNDDFTPRHTLARGRNRIPDAATLQPYEEWMAEDGEYH